MATYIKGNAVENAVSYTVYKKEGTTYSPKATKKIGKANHTDFVGEYVGNDGHIVECEDSIARSEMIEISELVNGDGAFCTSALIADTALLRPMAVLYERYNDFDSALCSIGYDGTATSMTLGKINEYLEDYPKAKYVIFNGNISNGDLYVYIGNNISIRLDDIGTDLLPAGESHTLVVEADSGNVIYEDSDYSKEVVWNRPAT